MIYFIKTFQGQYGNYPNEEFFVERINLNEININNTGDIYISLQNGIFELK